MTLRSREKVSPPSERQALKAERLSPDFPSKSSGAYSWRFFSVSMLVSHDLRAETAHEFCASLQGLLRQKALSRRCRSNFCTSARALPERPPEGREVGGFLDLEPLSGFWGWFRGWRKDAPKPGATNKQASIPHFLLPRIDGLYHESQASLKRIRLALAELLLVAFLGLSARTAAVNRLPLAACTSNKSVLEARLILLPCKHLRLLIGVSGRRITARQLPTLTTCQAKTSF